MGCYLKIHQLLAHFPVLVVSPEDVLAPVNLLVPRLDAFPHAIKLSPMPVLVTILTGCSRNYPIPVTQKTTPVRMNPPE